MESKTKRMARLGMLCAIAYGMVVVGRVPIVLFLKYDPKDIVIALGGLIWGPLTSCAVSVVVSLLEMVTISDNGILGCVMNIVSTCSFSCTAALLYQRRRTLAGAVTGLLAGGLTMAAVMLLWNYFVTPFYLGYPREAVAELLLPVFLPFNLLKAGLNAAGVFLLYKPITRALRKGGYLSGPPAAPNKKPVGLWLAAGALGAMCILLMLLWR